MNKINDVCAQARPQRTMFAYEILGTARHGTALQTSGIRV